MKPLPLVFDLASAHGRVSFTFPGKAKRGKGPRPGSTIHRRRHYSSTEKERNRLWKEEAVFEASIESKRQHCHSNPYLSRSEAGTLFIHCAGKNTGPGEKTWEKSVRTERLLWTWQCSKPLHTFSQVIFIVILRGRDFAYFPCHRCEAKCREKILTGQGHRAKQEAGIGKTEPRHLAPAPTPTPGKCVPLSASCDASQLNSTKQESEGPSWLYFPQSIV